MDGSQNVDQPGDKKTGGSHAAPEGAGVHPLIDLSRDPNPGKPDHAKPDED
ncbi:MULTISPECIES: hypothetical protein [Actinomycetes]|uniref:hypothetical protein n=1 Tax=Actinomycetes TaxID=1760 RepID=UPI0001B57F9A|nr:MULTISPECIES: hypothetical protein [Actinomycetes]